jgi:amino acid transporter
MGLSLAGDLETLANTVVLLLLFVFLSTNTAVLVLRRDAVDVPHWRTPVVFPVLGIASCLLLLWQQEARTWAFAGVLLAVGVLLYLATALPRRRAGTREDAGVSAGGR